MRTLSRTQEQTAQIAQLLATPGGRNKFAAAVGTSLRRRRDYVNFARKTLQVETLPDGALPIYDKEFDDLGRQMVEAFVVAEEGGDVQNVVKPKRVTVPTFDIVSNPMIPITQIKERRFDLVTRAINLAKAEIGAEEDGYIFKLFDAVAASAAGKPVTDPVYNVTSAVALTAAGITPALMADNFGQVERHDLSVAHVFCNPRDYTDFRKWTDATIDRETERKLLKTGVMGYLWGATILQTRKVAIGTMYILCDPEFLGVLPERIPITVMSADRPDLRQIGFSVFENVGFLAHNASGVQKFTFTRP